MSSLSLFLFGAPRLEREERPVPLRRTKALALLAYLAVTGRPHDRDALIGLFWPEFDAAAARNNLRRELSLLKSLLDSDDLLVEGRLVGMYPASTLRVDVALFENDIARARQHNHGSGTLCLECVAAFRHAAELNTADFMASFIIPDCLSFEEWQFFQREELRRKLSDALQTLVQHYVEATEYALALPYARRWVALDMLHEQSHRALMELYALDNQHAAALRQYEECRRMLDQELGVEPEPETTDLYKLIRTRQFPPVAARSVPKPAPVPPPMVASQLPSYTTPFIGRKSELAEVGRLIAAPSCRFLTIAGLGGIGKTRLVEHLAQQLINDDQFTHDVVWISLSAVATASGVVPAIARAVGFTFYSDVPPQQQLLDYLRDKHLLLLLDNFEHLLPDVDLLLDILATAPNVKLIVTSRERLSVEQELTYTIEGLAFPDDVTHEDVASEYGDAVQLFAGCARRARPDFVLQPELPSVVRICQLVEGMPLAIELAASWCNMLSCSAIAGEIQSNLDFLSSRLRNVPERHRSMRAVFEQSWMLLSDDERRALKGIAVFNGSFRREAAEAVAGAPLLVLAPLVEKSLLHITAGRYYLHELLRQFATEKLQADPDFESDVRHRHATHYVRFLAEQGRMLKGKGQREALAAIADEIENVRAAWKWAIDADNVALIEPALDDIYDFFHICGRYQEGEETLRLLIERLKSRSDHDDTLAFATLRSKVFARQGALWAVLGMARPAQQRLRESLADARQRGDRRETVFVLGALGELAMWQGRYASAEQALEESLRIAREIDDLRVQDKVLWRMAELAQLVGRYADGKRLARESLAISRMFGRQDRTAYALVMLGICCLCSGECAEAEQAYRESVDIFGTIGDQVGLALALAGVGWVQSVVEGSGSAEARALGERSVELARDIGNRFHLAIRLSVFGEILRGIGDFERAELAFQEGLALARTVDAQLPLIMCLRGLGDVAFQQGDLAASRQYLLEALLSAIVPHVLPGALAMLVSYAALLLAEGETLDPHHTQPVRQEQAFELLTFVLNHPLSWQTWLNRAAQYERKLVTELAPETVAAIRARAKERSLEDVVSSILRRDVIEPIGTSPAQDFNLAGRIVPQP